MTSGVHLFRSFATVGGWTMASRVFGFVRDVMIAAALGAGPVAEAFVIAFSIPNLFRRFFAEGAFNMAFVPMFAKRLEGDGPDVARDFGEEAFAALGGVLIILTVISQAAMPWLVLGLASGFGSDGKFELTVDFARIAFPYILFISLAALLSGVLNSLNRFAAAAAAPLVLNLIVISALGVASLIGGDFGAFLIWSIPVAGCAQLALVWVAASRAGMRLRIRRPRFTPAMRRLAAVALPAALAGGVVQINLVVGRQVASYFEGAVAWLYYADRLYQLPLGVVGVAIGVVLLPDLARRLRAGDAEGARAAVNRSTEFALALTLPAAVALIVIPTALTSVLFQRGVFTADDVSSTALAVAIYGAGLPAFVLNKVLSPIFFAREDTKSPFRYAVVCMIVNAVLAIGLIPWLGYLGAAVGTTAAAWVNVWLLWRGAKGYGDAARPDNRLRNRTPRILGSSLGMGAALLALATLGADWLALPFWRYFALLALVLAAMASYAALSAVTGAMRIDDVRRMVRRRA
jgi:putative peptidoglycan lipid II flippase